MVAQALLIHVGSEKQPVWYDPTEMQHKLKQLILADRKGLGHTVYHSLLCMVLCNHRQGRVPILNTCLLHLQWA